MEWRVAAAKGKDNALRTSNFSSAPVASGHVDSTTVSRIPIHDYADTICCFLIVCLVFFHTAAVRCSRRSLPSGMYDDVCLRRIFCSGSALRGTETSRRHLMRLSCGAVLGSYYITTSLASWNLVVMLPWSTSSVSDLRYQLDNGCMTLYVARLS